MAKGKSKSPGTAVVQWKGEAITVTFQDVKNLICPLANEQEVVVFLKTCQSLNLNPFANEIYLIKYSEKDKAAIVIAIESYLKSAETNDNYDGHEAGIVLRDGTGKLEFRQGSFLFDEEREGLVGGWAKVYRKDRGHPFYMAVNKAECLRYTKDGELTKFWTREKQPSMLRKTGLKRALVEAFPHLFSGVYSTAEFEPVPEGELPPAYQKGGEPDWSKFWARQKEKGLIADDVHSILKVQSLKEDWIDKGRTLEEAENTINDALTTGVRSAQGKEPSGGLGAAIPNGKPDNRVILWGNIKGLLGKLKASLPQERISGWFMEKYRLDVSMGVFDEEHPPEQLTEKILNHFHNSLLAYKDNQKIKS